MILPGCPLLREHFAPAVEYKNTECPVQQPPSMSIHFFCRSGYFILFIDQYHSLHRQNLNKLQLIFYSCTENDDGLVIIWNMDSPGQHTCWFHPSYFFEQGKIIFVSYVYPKPCLCR